MHDFVARTSKKTKDARPFAVSRRASPAFAKLFGAAVSLHQAGRLEGAAAAYRRAIRADNRVADAHNNLGCALLELGQLEEAAAAFERAIKLRPAFAAALDNLGIVYGHLGRHEYAVALHDRAIALEPKSTAYRIHRARLLIALQRFDEAQAAFEAVLADEPDNADARDGLGVALHRLGRFDLALAAVRAAVERNPGSPDAACNLGTHLLDNGEMDEALRWFERAVELAPRNPRYHLYLVRARGGAAEPAQVTAMEQLAAEGEALPATQRIDLHFALAAAYEHDGRYDDAFAQLAAGNALKRAVTPYDEPAILQTLAGLESVFSEPFMEAMRGCGNPSARPIFIFGMPRSGTTLVEQVLATQPGIKAAGELDVLDRLSKEFLPVLAAVSTVAELRLQIRRLGDWYLGETNELAGDSAHLTDKMPGNYWHAPVISLALPNARMIHVRRDPVDTCVSCFATLFAESYLPYTYDLGELGRYYLAYERLMRAWRALVPADRLIEVRYESLVEDFAGEAGRLLAFCGLPWDENARAFHAVRRPVRTASNVQVRRPLYRDAVGRGERFRAHLGPLLEILQGTQQAVPR